MLPDRDEAVTELDAYTTEVYTVGSDIDRPRGRQPGMNRRSPEDVSTNNCCLLIFFLRLFVQLSLEWN